MDNNQGLISCSLGCWIVGLLAGILAAVLLWVLGDWSFLQGAFVGVLVFLIAGALLSWLICRKLPAPGEMQASGTGADAHGATSTATAAGAATVGAASAAAAGAAAMASSNTATADTATADTAAADAGAAAADAAASDAGSAATAAETAVSDAATAAETTVSDAATAAADSAGAAASTASGANPAAATASVSEGVQLSGETELAGRKGEWSYQASEGAAEAAATATASSAGAAATAEQNIPDYDKDGVLEGTDEGTRPEALAGPRDGGADDLKQIKGIGPKLEKLCNSLGFYHFDQIANWTADEVAWVDANLEGFRGRVTRDTWVAQAKILAAGGETEFSKKVEKGGVYD